MRKSLAALAAILLTLLAFAVPAGAQDPVVGTVTADPATVPSEGEHTVTASGTGFIPDTTILVGACRSPVDTLVPGVSSTEEITEAALAIDVLVNCDVTGAQQAEVDSDGNFTLEVTATIGQNFFLSAGALDGSQQGAVWIPVVDPNAQLAVTGVEHFALAGLAAGMLLLGAAVLMGSRRLAVR